MPRSIAYHRKRSKRATSLREHHRKLKEIAAKSAAESVYACDISVSGKHFRNGNCIKQALGEAAPKLEPVDVAQEPELDVQETRVPETAEFSKEEIDADPSDIKLQQSPEEHISEAEQPEEDAELPEEEAEPSKETDCGDPDWVPKDSGTTSDADTPTEELAEPWRAWPEGFQSGSQTPPPPVDWPSGRRIVDLASLAGTLLALGAHGLYCAGGGFRFVRERRCGLAGVLLLECPVCKLQKMVPTATEELNDAYVLGTAAAGVTQPQARDLLTLMDVPVLSQGTYRKCRDKLAAECRGAPVKKKARRSQ